MIDKLRFQEFLAKYKVDFVNSNWKNEKFKWIAVKCFQDNWDINATEFADMLERSLAKTYHLLVSMNNFPRGMILRFAQAFPEEVRAMFINLFDEKQDVYERIAAFKEKSSDLLPKLGTGAAQHYQYESAITTYLWLRYPDKYTVYKYGEIKNVAEQLNSGYQIKKGAYSENIRSFIRLYDEINAEIKQDTEMVEIFRKTVTPECYPDPELRTLTQDFGFYISRYLTPSKNGEPADDFDPSDLEFAKNEWWPSVEEYTPGFTKGDWLNLLYSKKIIGPVWGGALAAFYGMGGAATCTQIGKKYNRSAYSVSGNCTNLAKRVYKETNCPISKRDNGQNRY